MFNSPYLTQTLPYPFLSLFGDTSIPIQDDEEQDDEEQDEEEQDEEDDEESVAE